MMLGTRRKAQPAPHTVRSGFVGELALEHKHLGALLVADDGEICLSLANSGFEFPILRATSRRDRRRKLR